MASAGLSPKSKENDNGNIRSSSHTSKAIRAAHLYTFSALAMCRMVSTPRAITIEELRCSNETR